VVATYLIIIPAAGLPDGRTAADIVAALNGFSFSNMNLALHHAVGSNTVSVVGSSMVTYVKHGGGGGGVISGPPDGPSNRLINVVVMIVGIGVGILACCCVLCRQWFKRRLHKPHFKAENNVRSNVAATASTRAGAIVDAGVSTVAHSSVMCQKWLGSLSKKSYSEFEDNSNSNTVFSLIKVTDRGLLARLSELFTPPAETRGSLGRNRDKERFPKPHSRLVVRAAWSVHTPQQQAAYEAKKAEIACQRQQIDETKGPKRTDPTPVLTDDVAVKLGVNTSCNEKLLLYGAKVNEVEQILHSGIRECNESAARFGVGVYLAEDPAKVDESVQADSPIADDGESKHLHRMLYEKHRDRHPGEVYYAFVCQASLGCPLYTKGPVHPRTPTSVCGPTNSCEEGIPVFDSPLQRELTSIPGTSPRILYNSLIVEKGRDSVAKLHREFVLFDTDAVLVKYLVAYSHEDGPVDIIGSV